MAFQHDVACSEIFSCSSFEDGRLWPRQYVEESAWKSPASSKVAHLRTPPLRCGANCRSSISIRGMLASFGSYRSSGTIEQRSERRECRRHPQENRAEGASCGTGNSGQMVSGDALREKQNNARRMRYANSRSQHRHAKRMIYPSEGSA